MFEQMNPAFLTLLALVIAAGAQLIGALAARRHYRRLNEIYDHIRHAGDANDGDRSWLRLAFYDASTRINMRITAVAAPFLAVIMPVFAVMELVKGYSSEVIERDIDDAHRARAKLDGADPVDGTYWQSELRREAQAHADAVEWKRSPLLTLWIAIWLIPGFAISLLAFGTLSAAFRVYRLLGEEIALKVSDSFARKA